MDLRSAAMDEYAQEQHLITKQVQANGEAIARVTIRQMEDADKYAGQPKFDDETDVAEEDMNSQIMDDHESFQNVFAKPIKLDKPEPSHRAIPNPRQTKKDIAHIPDK